LHSPTQKQRSCKKGVALMQNGLCEKICGIQAGGQEMAVMVV